MMVWMGSAVALLLAAVLGFGQLDLAGKGILLTAAVLYTFGVQLPTGMINVPLNNKLQTLDVDAMDETTLSAARKDSNRIGTDGTQSGRSLRAWHLPC